ncbi:hypothetical protein D0T53_10670 [Dysgonomonas sp. 216]|nr:hypothetical protein [Dysgonomonas sp. 216]
MVQGQSQNERRGNQDRHKRFNFEEYQKERVDFIIKEVGLTSEEKKEFIPLTNELLRKKFELNRDVRREERALIERGNITKEEYESLINKLLDVRMKEAQLEKEYFLKFKKVLPIDKLYKYQKAESRFTRSTVRGSGNPK